MNETKITEAQVREEHLSKVNPTLHWAYLFGVLVGSFVLMVILIAILGSGSGS